MRTWQKDSLLKEIDLGKYKLLCVDIFDTLLFRAVSAPEDIFVEAAKLGLARKVLPSHISPDTFKELRVLAAGKARNKRNEKKGNREVTLKEIYEELPSNLINIKELKEIELEIERKHIYLNEAISSLIADANKRGLRVILLSDMYLNLEEMKSLLLAAEFDLTLVGEIIISSEYEVSKANQDLYEVLLSKTGGIKKEEIIHIGDNFQADFLNARQNGLASIYYQLDQMRNLKYDLERVRKEKLVEEVFSLRKKVAIGNPYSNKKEGFWYDFGATVLGPIFSSFIDFVLETADREGNKDIFPIMRDGFIFGEMLELYNDRQGTDYRIKPLFISRQSSFLASLPQIESDNISDLFFGSSTSLASFFMRFSLENPFPDYAEHKMNASNSIFPNGEQSLYDEIIEFLNREEILEKINRNIIVARENLLAYLDSVGFLASRNLCVDVGYSGTTLAIIRDSLLEQGENLNSSNLLLIKKKVANENILSGLDLRGFLGEDQKSQKFFNGIDFKTYLLEVFMIGDFGTTISYARDGQDNISPVLADNNIEDHNSQARKIAQEGIMDYYQFYLDFTRQKPWIKAKIREKGHKLSWILERLMRYPTPDEAKYIGNLYFSDDFMSADIKGKLCPSEEKEKLRSSSLEDYLKNTPYKYYHWLPGIVESVLPYNMTLDLLGDSDDTSLQAIANMTRYMVKEKISEVIIYGAGELARQLIGFLEAYQIEIRVLVDSSEKLWGSHIEDIEIVSFEESLEMKINNYLIASIGSMEVIKESIIARHENPIELKIIDYKSK